MSEALAMLEALPAVAALRGSYYAYPLVNALHIVGIAVLFGAVLALDLRILGIGKGVALDPLAGLLVPLAFAGFGLAAAAGFLLFATDAGDYAASLLFRLKLGMITLAVANACLYRLLRRRGDRGLRIVAAVSILVWLAVILLGRAVGYY